MATVEAQDINQTVRVEGEINAYKANEAFRKFSEWWSRLKAAVRIKSSGGGEFIINAGEARAPSLRSYVNPETGLWLNPADNTIRYTRLGTDYGELVGNAFGAHVTKSNQTLGGAWTKVTWDTVLDFNMGGVWDPSLNTRLTAPVGGLYLVQATCRTSGGAAGGRYLQELLINNASSGTRVENQGFSSSFPSMVISTIVQVEKGDYFEIRMLQTTGLNVTIQGTNSSFQVIRIG
jgi:hypothetical protein